MDLSQSNLLAVVIMCLKPDFDTIECCKVLTFADQINLSLSGV